MDVNSLLMQGLEMHIAFRDFGIEFNLKKAKQLRKIYISSVKQRRYFKQQKLQSWAMHEFQQPTKAKLIVTLATGKALELISSLVLEFKVPFHLISSPFSEKIQSVFPDADITLASVTEMYHKAKDGQLSGIIVIFPEFEAVHPSFAATYNVAGKPYLASLASYLLARELKEKTIFFQSVSGAVIIDYSDVDIINTEQFLINQYFSEMSSMFNESVEKLPEDILSLPVVWTRFIENREIQERIDLTLIKSFVLDLLSEKKITYATSLDLLSAIDHDKGSIKDDYEVLYHVGT